MNGKEGSVYLKYLIGEKVKNRRGIITTSKVRIRFFSLKNCLKFFRMNKIEKSRKKERNTEILRKR